MQTFVVRFWYFITHRSFLWLLFLINLLGTIYGYIWYGGQLSETDPIFYIFVPDSPTASLFFTIAVFGWLMGKHFKLMEVLALITLVKYGVWAVAMNLLTLYETGYLSPSGWMLVCSHALMAVQAILYMPKYRFAYGYVLIGAVWTLHNDVIDYLFGQMPIYHVINNYVSGVGYFTFWLSIGCILIAIYAVRNRPQLQPQ